MRWLIDGATPPQNCTVTKPNVSTGFICAIKLRFYKRRRVRVARRQGAPPVAASRLVSTLLLNRLFV